MLVIAQWKNTVQFVRFYIIWLRELKLANELIEDNENNQIIKISLTYFEVR